MENGPLIRCETALIELGCAFRPFANAVAIAVRPLVRIAKVFVLRVQAAKIDLVEPWLPRSVVRAARRGDRRALRSVELHWRLLVNRRPELSEL